MRFSCLFVSLVPYLSFYIFLVSSVVSEKLTRKRRDTQLPLARSVDARSVNSPQVNKFLQVYHFYSDYKAVPR